MTTSEARRDKRMGCLHSNLETEIKEIEFAETELKRRITQETTRKEVVESKLRTMATNCRKQRRPPSSSEAAIARDLIIELIDLKVSIRKDSARARKWRRTTEQLSALHGNQRDLTRFDRVDKMVRKLNLDSEKAKKITDKASDRIQDVREFNSVIDEAMADESAIADDEDAQEVDANDGTGGKMNDIINSVFAEFFGQQNDEQNKRQIGLSTNTENAHEASAESETEHDEHELNPSTTESDDTPMLSQSKSNGIRRPLSALVNTS